MCFVNEKEALKEIKLLYGKDELDENDVDRWEQLSKSVRDGDFVCELLDLLDQDMELTLQIRQFMNTTGKNLQEMILGGVALGVYILDKLIPHDCGWDAFGKFWCDVCQCNASAIMAIDNAVNRALDTMIEAVT